MKIILACILLFSFNIFAKDVMIKNPEKLVTKQKGLYWCWAASVEALEKYDDKIISQESIITKWKNVDLTFLTFYKDDVFLSQDPIFYKYNIIKNMSKIYKWDIDSYIKQSKPVLYIANNHISLIVGYNSQEFYVMDTAIGKIIKINKNKLSFYNENLIGSPESEFFVKI